jgi:uncharacterized membrane protein YsdA (DUF1294 family)
MNLSLTITNPFLWILGYLIVINSITFVVYGYDKSLSTTEARRVSERTLLLCALFGGSIGAILAMQFFRHKTKKVSFQIWFILIFLLQLGLIWLLFQTLWTNTG